MPIPNIKGATNPSQPISIIRRVIAVMIIIGALKRKELIMMK